MSKKRISTRTITLRMPTALMNEVRGIVDGQTDSRRWRNYSHFIEEALTAAVRAERESHGAEDNGAAQL